LELSVDPTAGKDTKLPSMRKGKVLYQLLRLLLMKWVTIWACLMILLISMAEIMVPAMVKD